jgi:hypothetical protein
MQTRGILEGGPDPVHRGMECPNWNTCSAPVCPLVPGSDSAVFCPEEDERCSLPWTRVCLILGLDPSSPEAESLYRRMDGAVPTLWYGETPPEWR